ncbi:MAG: hypothetical protein IJV72_08565 [Clostridia bacterium]|nr:hypothetical protein [Clostridia bacterium]
MEKAKKKDRVMIVAVSVTAFVVAAVLVAVLLVPIWGAKLRLSKLSKAFENFSEADTVVVSDPLLGGSTLSGGVEIVLDEERGCELSDTLVDVIDGAKYIKTRKTVTGSWSMNLSIRTADGVYTVYLLEDEFYLAKDNKQYLFAPNGELKSDYDAFYEELVDILEQS